VLPEEDPPTETFGLLQRHREGDPQALQRLFERHYPYVERIVRVRLGRHLMARVQPADVVQATMLTALSKLDEFEPRSDARLRDWLARIAEGHVCNLARKRGELELGADDGAPSAWHPAAEDTSPSQRAGRAERKEIVDACMEELADRNREVILWKDYHQAGWEQIQEELGCPTREAAYQLYQRARAALREKVARHLRDGEGP
jgi:RNA polymerase sigma-70 factor (ECF subfamily)